MSTLINYTWPIADEIALVDNTQLPAGGRIFSFNGTYPVSTSGYVTLGSVVRELSITSASNLSAINFSISGLDASGKNITWTGAGPNATTIYTTGYAFSVIFGASVSADMAHPASIGVGLEGFTQWFLYNIKSTYPSLSVQTKLTNATITYSFESTLDDVTLYAANAEAHTVNLIPDMVNATTDLFGTTIDPMLYARFVVTDSDGTSEMVATILQQGQA